MFWERFYGLCRRCGKKPNPVGKEIGLSSGIISKWKAGGIPNGETLMKLSKYFHVSTDYLLGLSPAMSIVESEEEPLYSSAELVDEINENLKKLNNSGLTCVADYSEYLSTKIKYCGFDDTAKKTVD